MDNSFIYVEVALPLPFYQTFTYKISKEIYETLKNKELIGRRVLVPFRNLGYTGIVLKKIDKDFSIFEDYEVKEIEEIPDDKPIFTQKEISIAQKISDYYVAPLGITLYYLIPEGLRWKKEKGKWIKKSPENYVYFIKNYNFPKLTERQKELVDFVLSNKEVAEFELIEANFSKSTINALVKKGILGKSSLVFKTILEKKPSQEIKSEKINLQKKPLYLGNFKGNERIKKYIKIIKELNSKNKSVMIIFPSIALLKKSYDIFSKNLNNVYAYHDGIPAKENIKTWFKLQEKTPSVLLTSYSGILMPVKNLGLIILEEEGSDAYKTKRTPKFDTRRVVYEVYKEKSTFLIFSSFVPSVETYYSLKKKIFLPFAEKKDIEKKKIKILPFDREFSLKNLTDILKDNKKTLILANKKAYASFLYCQRCEEEIICEECDIPLKVYKDEKGKFLKCEICNTKYKFIERCPECETKLEIIGAGIEKIEEVLKKHFKNEMSYLSEEKDTRIKLETTVMDKDLIIDEFEKVINIFPDFFLFMQDYKGREKLFRNIIYSYIKAKDEFILFTNQQNDFSVKSFLNLDFNKFYEKELQIRKRLDQPPFKNYILLTFEKKKLDISFLNELFKAWIKENNIKDIEYKGIFKGYYSFVKGKERAQMLLIDFKDKDALKNLSEKCRKLGIKLIVDINPVNLI